MLSDLAGPALSYSQRLNIETRQMRLYDGVTFWIERQGTDGQPVSSVAGPARQVEFARPEIYLMSGDQNRMIVAGMALSRTNVADAALAMIEVVPMYEADRPTPSIPKPMPIRACHLIVM
jgi:hypothetical protein